MSQPRSVDVSNGIPHVYHDTIRHLIELVATLMQAPLDDCEVHVKAGSRKFGQTSGYAYYTYDGKPWSEQLIPSRINVAPGVRYLITLRLNEGFAEFYTRWPSRDMHYARYRTFPHTWVYAWEEEFVYVCAHEMHHVKQFDGPRNSKGRASASELDCEYNAIGALTLYRVVVGQPAARANTAHAARR